MSKAEEPVVLFYFDISCPFAYIASTRIEALAARAGAKVIWAPVVLGIIYRETAAVQGAGGSASDPFNPRKKAVAARSLDRTLKHFNVPLKWPSKHPRKTTTVVRLIHSIPNEERSSLAKAFYQAYWVNDLDITDPYTVVKIAREAGVPSTRELTEADLDLRAGDADLRDATDTVIARGASGVPSFWIPDETWIDEKGVSHKGRLYWGQDRLHFVEAILTALRLNVDYSEVPNLRNLQHRCQKRDAQHRGSLKLQFWFDFSSPWSFLGWTQLERIKRETGTGFEIEMKPFLLGALFKEIGAPIVPMHTASKQQKAYQSQDLRDWVRHWNALDLQEGSLDGPIKIKWPTKFPIRSPTLLRCAMIEPATIPVIYRACWEEDIDVCDEEVLIKHLTKAGFDAINLLTIAATQLSKDRLRQNTQEAVEAGLCGAPSYFVFDNTVLQGGIVWGQDQLNVVQDLLAGWKEQE